MKSLRFKKATKKVLTGVTISSLLFTNAMPIFAADQVATPTFSGWALEELLEGEKYGVFPISWYEQDMRRAITMDELTQLSIGIGSKMLEITGTTEKLDTSVQVYRSQVTRQNVLDTLFAIVSNYNYAKDLGFDQYNAIDFMREKGVIQGDEKGLNLDAVCTVEQAVLFATRVVDAMYEELDAGAKGLLWVAKKGDNTVYMLGSIHLADTSIYPFSEALQSAYNSADELVLEVDFFNQQGQADFMNLQYYTDGTTVKDYISEDYYEKLTNILKGHGIGVQDLGTAKLWAVTNTLSVLSATNDTTAEEQQMSQLTSIDMYFATKAAVFGKSIEELEGYKFQGEMFDNFSPELQQYLFETTVDGMLSNEEIKDDTSNIQEMLKFWEEGNAEGLNKYVFSEDEVFTDSAEEALAAEYHNQLFTIRDKGMADKIEQMLNKEGSKTYFVVVGAGHYISSTGVISQLREKGFEVNQIK